MCDVQPKSVSHVFGSVARYASSITGKANKSSVAETLVASFAQSLGPAPSFLGEQQLVAMWPCLPQLKHVTQGLYFFFLPLSFPVRAESSVFPIFSHIRLSCSSMRAISRKADSIGVQSALPLESLALSEVA